MKTYLNTLKIKNTLVVVSNKKDLIKPTGCTC